MRHRGNFYFCIIVFSPVPTSNVCPINVKSITCGSSFKTGSVGSDESGIATLSRFSHANLERTARDVRPIELHVDDVDAVLSRDETDSVLVWKTKGKLTREPKEEQEQN